MLYREEKFASCGERVVFRIFRSLSPARHERSFKDFRLRSAILAPPGNSIYR